MNQVTRNDALQFAARTKTNLEHIEDAYGRGIEVHVVTQVILSTLGLVVFLRERNFVELIEDLQLSALEGEGWPHWKISLGESTSLGQVTNHLRNAIAHGRIQFSSDSRVLEEVEITIEDAPKKSSSANWRASIQANDLRLFCLKLVERIEQELG